MRIDVQNIRRSYGILSVHRSEYESLEESQQIHLHNAAQLLAIILENRHQAELLRERNLNLSREMDFERRFRDELVRTLPLFVFILELEPLRFSYLNEEALTAFSYPRTKLEELNGKELMELLHPADREAVGHHLRELEGAAPGTVLEQEFRVRDREGSFHWLRTRMTPFREKELPERPAVVGCAMEITHTKQTEHHLRRTIREKQELLREVHHRVKNNMQIISSLLNLQRRDADTPTLEGILQRLQSRINSMAAVHDQLYRQENADRVLLKDYLHTLMNDLIYTQTSYGNLPCTEIDVDPEIGLPLTQALPLGLMANELLSNGLQHAFAEPRLGTIRLSFTAAAEGQWELQYADDGSGFTPDPSHTARHGLGMTLLQILARQLDGQLSWGEGPGTRVSLRFPAAVTPPLYQSPGLA
jgi:PAS domain S-box-containing protein